MIEQHHPNHEKLIKQAAETRERIAEITKTKEAQPKHIEAEINKFLKVDPGTAVHVPTAAAHFVNQHVQDTSVNQPILQALDAFVAQDLSSQTDEKFVEHLISKINELGFERRDLTVYLFLSAKHSWQKRKGFDSNNI